MIARIIKLEVSVLLQSLRLRPVTQSEGLAILSITQEPNESNFILQNVLLANGFLLVLASLGNLNKSIL